MKGYACCIGIYGGAITVECTCNRHGICRDVDDLTSKPQLPGGSSHV
jgi:hypothetical protein